MGGSLGSIYVHRCPSASAIEGGLQLSYLPVFCGHHHGLCKTDPAFALEELDSAEKAKGNRCSLWSHSEVWSEQTGGKSGRGRGQGGEQSMGWLPLSTEAAVHCLAAPRASHRWTRFSVLRWMLSTRSPAWPHSSLLLPAHPSLVCKPASPVLPTLSLHAV